MNWRDLVSPRVGIVTELAPQPRGAEEPMPPHLYTATLAHFDFRAAPRQERLAAGKGRTEEQAQRAAIGEAAERYAACHWDPRGTFVARAAAVRDAEVIAPADCVLYAAEQYARPEWPYHRWDPAQEVTWVRGVGLPGGEVVALPASLVYLLHPLPRPEDFFAPATSNGLAAGEELEAALLGALHELVERDALLLTWMHRLPALELDVADHALPIATVVRHYARVGVAVRAFALRTDQPATVVMAIAFDEDIANPAQVVGMGCDLSPARALEKAVFELCQARPSELQRHRGRPPRDRLRSYADVHALEDHAAFLGLRENAGEFAFLWRTGERASLAALPDRATGAVAGDLGRTVAALTAAGHRVAYAELTTPDVAACGLRVVRAIAAGFQPIHFGHGEERLGGDRLFEAPRLLGFGGGRRTAADLNPCPHPLA